MYKQLLSSFVIFCLATNALADCQDVTLDRCSGNEETPPFETLTLPSAEDCQEYCRDVFTDVCTFFIYDRQQVFCQLFDNVPDIYASSCALIGGTPNPSLTECQESNDECLVRTILEFSVL